MQYRSHHHAHFHEERLSHYQKKSHRRYVDGNSSVALGQAQKERIPKHRH